MNRPRPAARAVPGAIALLLAATSCTGPTWYETAQREGNPVYRCALSHTIGNRSASFIGFFRADGSALFDPEIEAYTLAQSEPALVAKLEAHFATLARDPAQNCSIYEGPEGVDREHYFACADSWSEGEERFFVGNNRIEWSLEREAQRVLSLDWSLTLHQDFAAEGFPWGESLGPVLHVERPVEWGRANARILDRSGKRLVEDRHHETGEIRAGERFYRQWSASNVALSVPWPVWPELHKTGEAITITLQDSELGLTRRYELPAGFPRTIEARLQRAQAELRQRERDPVNRCKAIEKPTGGPPIILVH